MARRGVARLRAGGSGFSPNAAFFAGRKGFALDFSDVGTLFQDSLGTTAVSANADPIGYARDLSGNGCHAIQATGAARPVFATSNPRATFSGSQFLSIASVDLSGSSKATIIVSFLSGSTSGMKSLVANGATANGAGSYEVNIDSKDGFVKATGTAVGTMRASEMCRVSAPFVLEAQIDISQATLALELVARLDGDSSQFVGANGPLGTGNLSALVTYIGAGPGGLSQFHNGDIYRIAVVGGTVTADELERLRYWAGAPAAVPSMTPSSVPAGLPGISFASLYGQSLAQGETSTPPISTSQPYDSLMFVGGARTNPAVSHGFDGLSPLVESTSTTQGETPISGALQIIKERGGSTQYLGAALGSGGTPIATLKKPNTLYDSLLNTILFGRRRANERGNTFKTYAFLWVHGEADTGTATYAATLNTLRGDLDADVKKITKQTDDVWCICDQVAIPTIALQQYTAQESYSNIRIACPLYFLPYSDSVHMTNRGSKILGAYYGYAYKRLIVDGATTWKPLVATYDKINNVIADVTFDTAVGNLVLDTTTVAAQTNSGFYLFNSAGVAQTITSVTILNANTVRVVASATITADSKLRIGFSDATRTTQGGLATNLRDSQGDTVVFDPSSLNYPLHNWAVAMELRINRNRFSATESMATNASWPQQAVTCVGTATDPRGGSTAATMTRTGVGEAGLSISNALVISAQQTISVYAKSGTANWLVIRCVGVSNGDTWFNLSTGAVGTKQAGITSAAITADANGFYRCSVTFTTGGVISPANRIDYRMSNADGVLTGAVGETLTVWGAQLDLGTLSAYEGKA